MENVIEAKEASEKVIYNDFSQSGKRNISGVNSWFHGYLNWPEKQLLKALPPTYN